MWGGVCAVFPGIPCLAVEQPESDAGGLISAWLGSDVKQLAQVHGGHPL